MRPCPNHDLQLIGKIEATTHGIAEKMTTNLEQVDAAVSLTYNELDNAEHEFEKLKNLILKDVGHLNQLIQDPDQLERDDALLDFEEVVMVVEGSDLCCEPSPRPEAEPEHEEHVHEPVRKKEIIHLIEQDGPGLEDQQPQNSLLKRAQENLEGLKQKTDMRFESVLRDLGRVTNKAKKQCQKEGRETVEKELNDFKKLLKDLLKSHRGQSRALPPSRVIPSGIEESITKTFL